jgi:biotin transport system substrate-specific component
MPSTASTQPLVPALWPTKSGTAARDVLLVLGGTALICIAAKIKVPFYPVPMTLQTLAVTFLAATYGMRLGTLTVLVYLFEGALGLPVFANTPPALANPAYFLGPTGGFLVGFVLIALIVGASADRGFDRSIPKLFAAIVVGELGMFALGFGWLAWFANLSSGAVGLGASKALAGGVAPFVLGDLLKVIVTTLTVPAARLLVEERDF